MSNNTIVVGDLHGEEVILNFIKYKYKNDKIICVGDYVDDFINNIISQSGTIESALKLAQKYKEDVYLLGNHDIHYVFSNFQHLRCSGFSTTMNAILIPKIIDIRKNFKYFYYDSKNRILITHAGLTKKLWDSYNLNFDNLERTLTRWTEDLYSPFFFIGERRGGRAVVGGPLWCDWNSEFEPIPDLIQIVGHTPVKSFEFKETNVNIDCLKNRFSILMFETDDPKMFRQVDIDMKEYENFECDFYYGYV